MSTQFALQLCNFASLQAKELIEINSNVLKASLCLYSYATSILS